MSWIFVSRIIGIICFFIVVVLAKILTNFTAPNGIYQKASEGLLFANFWLLLLIGIVLFIADIFGVFPIPLNLPAPIIRAFGSVFCIAFILSVFQWVDGVSGTNLYPLFWLISFLLIPIVFIIVLASGYYEIMRQLWWHPRLKLEGETRVVREEQPNQAGQPVSNIKSWEEIGTEFRAMLYDIIHRFREEILKK